MSRDSGELLLAKAQAQAPSRAQAWAQVAGLLAVKQDPVKNSDPPKKKGALGLGGGS